MSTTVADEILDRALKQPDTDRARIAEALIASLEAPTDNKTEKAWQAEINKRLQEIDSGAVQCIPWEVVRDRLNQNAHVQR